jgi:hypothetical protein
MMLDAKQDSGLAFSSILDGTNHSSCRVEKLNAIRKAEAVQTKRDQWKAASARYYERHPEVKEKKRLKAAEQRCARHILMILSISDIYPWPWFVQCR